MTECTDLLALAANRNALRQALRSRRRKLDAKQQADAARLLVRQLFKLPQFMRAHHIALYIANDGEISPQPLAEALWKIGKHVYLPVLRPDKHGELWFVRYHENAVLTPNRFGIPEPDFRHHHRLPAQLLDVALMPLVGFDRMGDRLGMGGGFYDRTFAFKQQKSKGRPYLIGLAHSCQEVEQLTNASWDIPLFAVATEREIILTGRA